MSTATLRREGTALVFSGALDRAAAQALWPSAQRALDGARRLDVSAVSALDSAGLALLVALAARLRAARAAARSPWKAPRPAWPSCALRIA
ncbi:phospholipid transport system transporter-binding protein [Pseudoxanthomonas sp. SORGH_AS 997]|nr:phospholipid transport system transporter-binding protein [Pseudoxanthomonas sp. SORGH_AS_0997]